MAKSLSNTSAPEDFIAFALKAGALQFGEFQLKSGRTSPYFFNSNAFYTAENIRALGRFYAEAMGDLAFDTLFGPAYKGVPLLGAVGAALGERHQGCRLSYNRKEAKAHGDKGRLGGAPIKGRTLIVDDVITAGTAVRESIQLIKDAGGVAAGVVVCFDRCEKGGGEQSTLWELEDEYKLPVIRIATFHDLYAHIQNNPSASGSLDALDAYRQRWGAD